MELTITELKSLWNKEKDNYRTQEVGSGVQKFVKDVLECSELFDFREGKLSTPNEKRKNEFVCEVKSKERRKPDITIFITSEVVIPAEIEQYGNIQAGINQLLQYQKDLDKKYGILTDGYTWRFYNNNLYREFTLQHIFDETQLFLEFWKEYTKSEYYYLSFFEGPKGQQFLFTDIEKLYVEENRQMFFQDITNLIRRFKAKLEIEGYFNGLEKKERKKRATEITYAYIIQFILYKTLVDNAFSIDTLRDFGEEYKEYLKKTYEYLKSHRYKDILAIIKNISDKISQNIYRPFTEEQKFISQKFQKLYDKIENQLSDVSPWLDIFVFIKKYRFENVRNEIFGYIYENYLKELYEKERKGQYFTDPAVVNFMLKQIGYTADGIKQKIKNNQLDKLSIIDPACGSGTFLYSAIDQIIRSFGADTKEASEEIEGIVTKNVFGLDIEEFPLYLAEMNILMRMLPLIITQKFNNPVEKKIKVFLTKDSVAEFIHKQLDFLEPDYESFMRVSEDIKEMKESLKGNHIPRRRFDYVIANPPYVGYNECSKQSVLITKLIQKKKVQMSNIYGVNLNTVPGRIKAYAPKPNLYAFFIALGLALLKDNGKLCYIIPQTILTARDSDVLRYHLAKFITIERIVTFTRNLFISRGVNQKRVIPTSSLIFVVSKKPPAENHKVEIIDYKDSEDTIEETMKNILKGRKIDKKRLLQSKLLESVGNWNFIKQRKVNINFSESYKKNSNTDIYRIPEFSIQEFNSIFYFDKGLVFPKNKIIDISKAKKDVEFYYLSRSEPNKYQLSTTDKIIYEQDIRFPKGSQGIDVYKRKYKVVWRYMNPDRFYFSDKKIMISFNWVIISGDSKGEMFYLFSLLNSACNKFIFDTLLKAEGEKDILMGIKNIKEFFRIPKIIDRKQHIKDEIIKRTEEMLNLEEKTLSDFVDFSGVMLQKFDNVEVEENNLILRHNNDTIKLKIKNDIKLVTETIQKELKEEFKLGDQKINLSDLKNLPVIDFDKQKKIKDYIDDLVFVLYFNIEIGENHLNHPEKIKNLCSKNKFYKITETVV